MLLFETFFVHSTLLVLYRVSLLGTEKTHGCHESSLDTMLFTSTKGHSLNCEQNIFLGGGLKENINKLWVYWITFAKHLPKDTLPSHGSVDAGEGEDKR